MSGGEILIVSGLHITQGRPRAAREIFEMLWARVQVIKNDLADSLIIDGNIVYINMKMLQTLK